MIPKDIIIIGGGMVGAACAVGFAQLGLNIQLIEKSPLPEFDPNAPYDLRISAISAASVNLLRRLQAWRHIEKMRLCPYRKLETWEIDGFSASFHCADLNLPELGFMVENNLIQLGLWQALSEYPNAQTSVGVTMQQPIKCGEFWQCFLDNGESYCAPLIIAADGANSGLRRLAGIGLTGWQYRQNCMLILVETELAQQDTTWQQFFRPARAHFYPYQAIKPVWCGMTRHKKSNPSGN